MLYQDLGAAISHGVGLQLHWNTTGTLSLVFCVAQVWGLLWYMCFNLLIFPIYFGVYIYCDRLR